jgi:hypothetical protein
MITITAKQVENLKSSYVPFENEVLTKEESDILYKTLGKLEKNDLKKLIAEKIPQISEISAEILFNRAEISEAAYVAILDAI